MKMKNKYMGGGLNKRSMYEKGGLSEAQKKMDKNNNNKIDSEDLAMLRKAEEGMKMKYQDGGVPLKKKTIPQEGAKLPDTDKLSFNEAFDFYRNELGGGSRFMWKGKPYSTSTPEELLRIQLGEQTEPMSIKYAQLNRGAQEEDDYTPSPPVRRSPGERREAQNEMNIIRAFRDKYGRDPNQSEFEEMKSNRKKNMEMRMPPPMPGKI
jgi:hypothetical protein